jgi:hypothetical protein
VHSLEVFGIRDSLEQIDGRKHARDDAHGVLPMHAPDGQRSVPRRRQ